LLVGSLRLPASTNGQLGRDAKRGGRIDVASAFDALSEALEEKTSLFRIEARDRLRLALKEAGVKPACSTVQQLEVVLRKILPRGLLVRGFDDSLVVCDALADRASGFVGETGASDTHEDVFRRLGG
jgi:hypothetical protein